MKSKNQPENTSSSRMPSGKSTWGRRGFFKACLSSASVVASNPNILASAEGVPRSYNRVLLVNDHGTPITSRDILTGTSYIFNYPYVTTPCFLINLGNPTKDIGQLETSQSVSYSWPGGSGPEKSIVASSPSIRILTSMGAPLSR